MKRKSQIQRNWWRHGQPKFPYNVPGVGDAASYCPDCEGSGWIRNRTRAEKRLWAVERELNWKGARRLGMSHRKCINPVHDKWSIY